MSSVLLISDAAKRVKVEAHVLRYWEEELKLPIKRNELGHRYYTEEDVERFCEIKEMKEKGLQLRAIRMVLKNGKLSMLGTEKTETARSDRKEQERTPSQQGEQEIAAARITGAVTEPMQTSRAGATTGPDIIERVNEEEEGFSLMSKEEHSLHDETSEEKAQRLKWLLQQIFKETLRENNEHLCREVKESMLKELDYQFRMQEEREEERNAEKVKRDEEHFKKIDELLRKKRKLIK